MLFKLVWSFYDSTSSILSRNTHKSTVKCNQWGQVFSLRFAYLHNPEISMEEQIFTVCVSTFIMLFRNSLRLQLESCRLRKENNGTSISPVEKSHNNQKLLKCELYIYTDDFISLKAGLEKISLAWVVSTPRVIAIKRLE